MITFHPTISIITYLKATMSPATGDEVVSYFKAIFPEYTPLLTDSGSSSFALIVETLNLRGKRLILPSFLCNVLIPVLEHYSITPIFIDVDRNTYQPNISTYTEEVLNKADAVLVVATYGRSVPEEIVSHIKNKGKIVIEDCAHCTIPDTPVQNINSDARFYSLSKTLPVPDGGLAVLQHIPRSLISAHTLHLGYIKSWLKLFALPNFLFGFIKHLSGAKRKVQLSWSGVSLPHPTTVRLLSYYIEHNMMSPHLSVDNFSYCYPLTTQNPTKTLRSLALAGIIAEPLWNDPIVCHSDAQKYLNTQPDIYSETRKLSDTNVCIPLWHIRNKENKTYYEKKLQKAVPDIFKKFTPPQTDQEKNSPQGKDSAL